MNNEFFLSEFGWQKDNNCKANESLSKEQPNCAKLDNTNLTPVEDSTKIAETTVFYFTPKDGTPPIKKVLEGLIDCRERADDALEEYTDEDGDIIEDEDDVQDDYISMLESLSQAFFLLQEAIEALEQELNLIKWDCEDYTSHTPIVDILNILKGL